MTHSGGGGGGRGLKTLFLNDSLSIKKKLEVGGGAIAPQHPPVPPGLFIF